MGTDYSAPQRPQGASCRASLGWRAGRLSDMAPTRRKLDPAEERAIAVVWRWYLCNPDRFDLSFATIVTRVRARCPSADVGRIAAEFARRHRRLLRLGRWE